MGARGPRSTAGSNIVPLGLVPAARPEPPAYLRPYAQEAWRQTVAGLPAGYFDGASLPLLESYCAAVGLAKEAADALYADGTAQLVIRAPSGRKVPNPVIATMNAATRSAMSLATKLRINRSSRPKDRLRAPPGHSARAGLMFEDAD